MGKAAKRRRKAAKRKQVWEPDLENPVCPTCAGNDKLDTEDNGIVHCERCNINFWIEEAGEELGGPEDADGWTPCDACHGKGCHICLPSGPTSKVKRVRASAPVLGEMVEL